MSKRDEPVLAGTPGDASAEAGSRSSAAADIRRLLEQEPYAILCTHGEGQAYGSMVAFAFSPDLTTATFATPVTTRKYRLLTANSGVALVVDNRARRPKDMMEIEAVTVTGHAHRLEAGPELEEWTQRLLGRHEYLAGFVRSPSSALFRVDVVRCIHVGRFQEVREWTPRAG